MYAAIASSMTDQSSARPGFSIYTEADWLYDIRVTFARVLSSPYLGIRAVLGSDTEFLSWEDCSLARVIQSAYIYLGSIRL